MSTPGEQIGAPLGAAANAPLAERPGRALVVVDVQVDFCEGGALGVEGGNAVAQGIAEWLAKGTGHDLAVATRDHHIDPGSHFSDQPDYLDSWPPHCVVGTPGAELHPTLDPENFAAIFDKGAFRAAYSGFEGSIGGDQDGESLAGWLSRADIGHVDVVGIATDYCVRATALDAARLGFTTRLITPLTAPVHPDRVAGVLAELEQAGVEIIDPPKLTEPAESRRR